MFGYSLAANLIGTPIESSYDGQNNGATITCRRWLSTVLRGIPEHREILRRLIDVLGDGQDYPSISGVSSTVLICTD